MQVVIDDLEAQKQAAEVDYEETIAKIETYQELIDSKLQRITITELQNKVAEAKQKRLGLQGGVGPDARVKRLMESVDKEYFKSEEAAHDGQDPKVTIQRAELRKAQERAEALALLNEDDEPATTAPAEKEKEVGGSDDDSNSSGDFLLDHTEK
jgi:hypothetical protein